MSTFQQFFPGGDSSSSGGGGGVPATTTVAELLVVGGGSSGSMGSQGPYAQCITSQSNTAPDSGGNGGGVLVSSRWLFEQGCVYTVTVGTGGAAQEACGQVHGTSSSIIGYNAPPCALVGHASKRIEALNPYFTSSYAWKMQYLDKHCSPYHQIDQYTCHYGTSVGKSTFIKNGVYPTYGSPIMTICSGSAGGAGNPGCPMNVKTSMVGAGPTGPQKCQFITSVDVNYGSDGLESCISGSPVFYGPGGGGMNPGYHQSIAGVLNIACPSNQAYSGLVQEGGYISCFSPFDQVEMSRPSVSHSGCTYRQPNGSANCCVTAASANYGAGGGVTRPGPQALPTDMNGGSGVVFVRYPTDYSAAASVSGNTPTPAQPGYHVYRFNGDGSITF